MEIKRSGSARREALAWRLRLDGHASHCNPGSAQRRTRDVLEEVSDEQYRC